MKSLLLCSLLLCSLPLHAGVVRIITNNSGFGQGWMFLDNDSVCKVMTPAHVVEQVDGRLVPKIEVLDDRGHTFLDVLPEILSDRNERDVAVLLIRGADDPKICGVSRLHRVENLATRIATLSDLVLETTEGSNGNDEGQKPEPGAIVKVPVRVRQALMDTDQGSQFIVQPTNTKDRVVDGWSGSVIEDQEGPVGMLIKATGLAVRMDVIRQLIDASTGTRKPISPGHTLPPAILTVGSMADAASTTASLFAVDGPGWNILPKGSSIVLVIVPETAIRLQRIRLSYKSASNSVVGLYIAVGSGGDSGWEALQSCPADGASGTIVCPILPASVTQIQLTLKTSGSGPVSLSGLSIE